MVNDVLSFNTTNYRWWICCRWNSDSNISGDKIENCLGFDDYWIVKTDAREYPMAEYNWR
jgi:hypothetical protein